jgi:DNA-binding winged helix-turn-helix (wHTH) protein
VAAAGQNFRFGRFELDAGRRRLTPDGENFLAPDRPLDAPIVLVKNNGRFVSKDTIVEEAWRGIAAIDNAVVPEIEALRELPESKTEKQHIHRDESPTRVSICDARRGRTPREPVNRHQKAVRA